MSDSFIHVSQQQRWENLKNTFFLSITVWEPGSCGHDMGTRSLWSRIPHDETDTALNSVRQKTVVGRRCDVSLEQTTTENRTDYDRGRHRSATVTPRKSSADS